MNLLQELIRSRLTGGGGALPALTDPASPSDVASGKEYINGSGAKQTGTLVAYSAGDWLDATKPIGVVTSDLNFTSTTDQKNFLFNRTGITELRLPNTECIPNCLCQFCTGLEKITAQNAIEIGTFAFERAAIQDVVFPSLVKIDAAALQNCKGLRAADFGGSPASNQGIVGQYLFSSSDAFDTLVLRGNAVWNLIHINVFNSTKFDSGKAGGTLYVPAAMISDYQAATNWSVILGYENNQIKSIESTATDPDAPVDLTTHYIDGTLIASA